MLIYYDDAAMFMKMGLETKQPTDLNPDEPFFKWLVTFNQIVERERVEFRSQHQEIREVALSYFNQIRTEVCVPFIHRGRILGILNLGRKSDTRWNLTARELGLLDRLRKSVTLALENALLHQTRLDIQEKQIQAELLASASSSLAHSIKNPLGLLCANLDLLRESTSRFSDQEIGSALLDTEIQVRKIEGIINQIRNANIGPSELESLRLDLMIYEILSEQVDSSIETEIRVEPTEIMADQGQIRLALTNIVINACQAMTISVDSSNGKYGKLGVDMIVSQDDQALELKISDTGCGMSNILITQILSRPFVTKKKMGTGLGVWTAKKIIEAHRGKRDCESKETEGTIAIIVLPLSISDP
jgi:signal transduction histidine kinase